MKTIKHTRITADLQLSIIEYDARAYEAAQPTQEQIAEDAAPRNECPPLRVWRLGPVSDVTTGARLLTRLEKWGDRQLKPGDVVALFRDAHGLRQEDLAARLGVAKRAVENWEGGQRNPMPYLERALRDLARELCGR